MQRKGDVSLETTTLSLRN